MTFFIGSYKCDGCGASVPSGSEDTRAWDWFIGYLPAVRHFCPACQGSDQHIREMKAACEAPKQGGSDAPD